MRTPSGRIPKATGLFNAYINNTEVYLRGLPVPPPTAAAIAVPAPANYIRLGLTDTEMNSWTSYKNQWNTLYAKYSDKAESRTMAVTIKLRDLQEAFMTFARPLLNIMASNRSATEDDAAVLHFILHRAEPVHPITPIDQVPTFSAIPIGGAEIKFSVRPTHDSKRASKLPGATGIELRYDLGDAVPASAMDCPNNFTSTKSIFILPLPGTAKGKTMHVSARWIVANTPARNGPWSGIFSVVVA